VEKSFHLLSDHEAATLFGLHDEHLKLIEAEFGVKTVSRGQELTVSGPEPGVEKVGRLVDQLLGLIRSGQYLRRHEVVYAIRAMEHNDKLDLQPIYSDRIEVLSKRQFIVPKTAGQKLYVDAIRRHDIVFAIGMAGTGKCVAGSTLVLTNRGLVPIASLGDGTKPDSYTPIDLQIAGVDGVEAASHVYNGGRSATRKLRVRSGYEIETTPEHPLLRLNSDGESYWMQAGDLKQGDFVAIQRGQRFFGQETAVRFQYLPNGPQDHSKKIHLERLDEEFAYFLGLLTGDGCLTFRNRVILSSADAEIISAFQRTADRFGLHVFRNGKNRPYDRIIASSGLYQLLLHLGMSSGLANTKRVPEAIRRAPEECVVAFLQGLFDTDGSADKRDGYVEFVSASKQLVNEVHLLLLNLGILANKRLKQVEYRGEKRPFHLLDVRGVEAERFYQEVGFRLARKQNRQQEKRRNTNIDLVPNLAPLIQAATAGMILPRRAHLAFQDYKRGRRQPSYSALGEMVAVLDEFSAPAEPVAKLKGLHEQHFFWAEIEEITESESDVYDLTVPGSHSFCANGFVNHNTYLAMAMAVNALKRQEVSRIILTRPAVEAGESLGFLPGTFEEKVNPYLRPLYDALYEMMDVDRIQKNMERGVLEVAPLAYMRGRTLNDSFVILDEAQNCTPEQMKMFLTRLGFDSKAVVTGDVTQSDLPQGKQSGLDQARQILQGIEGIGFVEFSDGDVVRHELVQKIVKAYEEKLGNRNKGPDAG